MLRLLIVDDEVIVRKWLTLVFQPFDKEFVVVDAAANGHEALEICRIHAIDIVITDIIMPDMDGMSFIQALREFNLHTQVIILSNHADFSLAQKGMSFGAAAYLLKGEITEEELLEATRRAGKKLAADDNPPSPSFLGISSHQVSELLTGGTGEVLQAFDRALISEKDTVWCIVFSQDVTPAVSSSLGMTNGAEWTNQLTALLAAAELSGTVGMITDHIAAAVVRTMGISEDVFCERVHKLLTLPSRLSFSLGVDGPASNSKELEHAFSHACDALNDRFFRGPGAFCRYRSTTGEHSDFRKEINMVQTLIQGNELDRLKNMLKQISARRDKYTIQDIDHLRRVFNTMAETLIHHTLSYCPRAAESQLAQVNPLAEINGMVFLDDIIAWSERLIDICHNLLRQTVDDSNMGPVLKYIEQNYMHNLTLSQISTVAGFSPNYFCNIFKACTGKSVSAYLTDLRIQQAKRLLTTTSKSINLIAEDVGYEASSYFIKIFKDTTGMTPNRFRRMNR